jgi:hypothetical protein
MFKLLTTMVLALGLLTACTYSNDERTKGPTHKVVELPEAPLATMSCAESCAILYDEAAPGYVMLFEDGSTITWKLPL